MAMADYYLCDVCGGKAFYDANLNYTTLLDGTVKLERVSSMAVICDDCKDKYQAVIQKINDND